MTKSHGRCRAHGLHEVDIRRDGIVRLTVRTGGGDDTIAADFHKRRGEVAFSRFDGGGGHDRMQLDTEQSRGRKDDVNAPTYRAYVTGSVEEYAQVRTGLM